MKKKLKIFAEHFIELKKRLVYILVFFLAAAVISYIFSDEIYKFLLKPLESYFIKHNLSREIIYTGLSEAFFTYIKLAIYVSIVLIFPVIIWHIYRFISPGLLETEKHFILPIFIISPILFIIGVIIVYYFILPAVFEFFLSFEQSATKKNNLPIILEARVSEYLSLCLTIMVAFGLAFQMPIIIIILTKLNVISSSLLARFRRLSIVIIFIIAAIITPPDIISQITLAAIMIILYELSIFAARYIEKNKR